MIISKGNTNQEALLLLKAGLWEQYIRLPKCESVDYYAIYKFASEQAILGLVAAGLEYVVEKKYPKEFVLSMVEDTLLLEERNKAMNAFIGELMTKMRKQGINALLVKGQGIAQCYERPLWRTCGDVDLFLDQKNYNKAKIILSSLAQKVGEEDVNRLHFGITINSWTVELHGTLRPGLGKKIDKVMDSLQENTFGKNLHRIWKNGNTDIRLPAPEEDVLYVFIHILQHFFKEGIGLRQLCDWCRLLWKYHQEIDVVLLENRLSAMGVISEWKSFAALAVDYLGAPVETMPLYSSDKSWKRKANRILSMIMESGNLGHKRNLYYREKYPYLVRKTISFRRSSWDSIRKMTVFPQETIIAWSVMVRNGIGALIKGL